METAQQHISNYKNSGFAHVAILLVVVAVIIGGVLFYMYKNGGISMNPSGNMAHSSFSVEAGSEGYLKVKNDEYNFSFEFPSTLKQSAPSMEILEGSAVVMGFQPEKRLSSDVSAPYAINFSVSSDSDLCLKYESMSGWTKSSRANMNSVENKTDDSRVVIFCDGSSYYTFSYAPQNNTSITDDEIATEKEAFDYMVNSFVVGS